MRSKRLAAKLRVPAIAAVLLFSLAMCGSPASGDAKRPHLPSTFSGIHLAMVFDFKVPDNFSFRGIDAVWAASKPVPGRFSTYYIPFERDLNRDYSLQWWQTNHPDWIEYRCDHTRATEFGNSNATPLDIANPAVRHWQWSHEVVPALQRGYQGIAFDNLNLTNYWNRCGHYDAHGQWVSQFAGPGGVQRYQRAVLSWADYMRSRLHDVGRAMGINYSYSTKVSWALNLALLSTADWVFDEAGVTRGGDPVNHSVPYSRWRDIFRAAWQIQQNGVCYELNGEEPQDTYQIPLQEREWIVGNYLLLKDRCTFVYITGYRAYTPKPYAPQYGNRDQDYGIYDNFPEYHLPIGVPLSMPESSGGLWYRRYSHGIVLVNPTDGSYRYTTRRRLFALGSRIAQKTFSLAPHSSVILLPVRAT